MNFYNCVDVDFFPLGRKTYDVHRVGFNFVRGTKHCSLNPGTTTRPTAPPSHGAFLQSSQDSIVNFPPYHPGNVCDGKRTKLLSLNDKAEAGYVGPDVLRYDHFTPEGRLAHKTVNIDMRRSTRPRWRIGAMTSPCWKSSRLAT